LAIDGELGCRLLVVANLAWPFTNDPETALLMPTDGG